jgi:hypothetical protein
MQEEFLKAIDEKRKVEITFNSKSKGIITRICIPYDFGPSQKKDAIDLSNRYFLWDLSSPEKPHVLSISPDRLLNLEILDEYFNPNDYVKWYPTKWIYKRDWGLKS